MKKVIVAFTLASGFALSALAAQWTGVIMDEKCSGNAAMKDNAACAERCIKGGSPAVLVTDDGTVYKIADQQKVVKDAGKKVTITGKMADGSIKVDKVKL